MRFDDEWLECGEGSVRPVIRAEILAADSHRRTAELLVASDADRTVISANVLEWLKQDTAEPRDRIGEFGGVVDSGGGEGADQINARCRMKGRFSGLTTKRWISVY